MAQYIVEVLSDGGGKRETIQIEALSSEKAKRAAVSEANAEAEAMGRSYRYHAVSCSTR